MNKLIDFLGGIKTVEEANSPVNGKIEVIKSFAFGTYIQVGGLTQTGGVVNDVWKTSLKKIRNSKLKIRNCLILGLGGGGNAGIVRKFWPDAIITGIDIDPVMVAMGKKYFHLDDLKVKIVIDDAYGFITKELKNLKTKKPTTFNSKLFDLILVDLYLGDKYPEKFETENYIRLIKTVLSGGGIAIFNRLYYGEKRTDAVKFLKKLEEVFVKVDVVYPEANVMYICHS